MSSNIEKKFNEDCKKMGIAPFDFNSETGPWRSLYLEYAKKGKPGKFNSEDLINKIGVRLQSRLLGNKIFKLKGEKKKSFKEACNEVIAEIKLMRSHSGNMDDVYERDFTIGSLKRILEDYRKKYKDAEEQMKALDYYDPYYKPTKVQKDGTE